MGHNEGQWRALPQSGDMWSIEGEDSFVARNLRPNNAKRIAAEHNAFDGTDLEPEQIKIGMVGQMHRSLNDLMRSATVHFFEPRGHETPHERDTCAKCGNNLRDSAHVRAEEGHPKDVLANALRQAHALVAEIEK